MDRDLSARPGRSVPVAYLQNAARYGAARDDENRRSALIARLRLATFLPAAGLLVWTLSRNVSLLPIVASVSLFVVFGILVAWHSRVDERAAWYEALQRVNLRALARIARDWKDLPEAGSPPDLDLSAHPYAQDLDLFGRASLLQWLGPAATPAGRSLLIGWLLAPASRAEILARQEAAIELAPLDSWREHLAAHGVLAEGARQADITRFLAWAAGGDPFGRNALLVRVIVWTLTSAIWILIVLHLTGIVPAALWTIPLVAGFVVWFALGKQLADAFDRAGGGQQALSRYAALFEHAVSAPRSSSKLADLHARLSAGGEPAATNMRRLNRILGCAELRRSSAIIHLPIQALTLWDFHVSFALERWRRRCGPHLKHWVDALGELDALALLASVRRDNPDWCTPEVVTDVTLVAEAMGHPLIADDRRVPNDVTVGPPGTILLVTGSNMSGKSTLLRAIGLNVVMAQAGSAVCARRMGLPEADLQTSIHVQDSLERGLSSFMAALARLKGVVDAAEHERKHRVLLFLLDEILQGTNSAERSVAVRAVTRHLLQAGAIGAMTTHDLALAAEEPLKDAARLVHFTETVDEKGVMEFDYRLRPGLATSRNALRLMQMIGIEP
jgi:hypothetical protein